MTTKGKIITWITAVLLVAAAVFVYFKFYFVSARASRPAS